MLTHRQPQFVRAANEFVFLFRSQEVLTTIESERLSKSRHIALAALVTFPEDFDNGLMII
ncbi:hypothetical protein WN943_009278 [Citrus x changshan-huyou]